MADIETEIELAAIRAEMENDRRAFDDRLSDLEQFGSKSLRYQVKKNSRLVVCSLLWIGCILILVIAVKVDMQSGTYNGAEASKILYGVASGVLGLSVLVASGKADEAINK